MSRVVSLSLVLAALCFVYSGAWAQSRLGTDAMPDPPVSPEGQVTLNPVADAFTNSFDATVNFGTRTFFWAGDYHDPTPLPTPEGYTYLKFQLGIPAGAVVTSATLHSYCDVGANPPFFPALNIGAHYLSDDSWQETVITWNNAPFGFTPSPYSTEGVRAAGEWYTWNLTGLVQTAHEDDGVLSLVLKPDPGSPLPGDGRRFVSRHAATNLPYLEITYTLCPDPVAVAASPPFTLYFHDQPVEGWGLAYEPQYWEGMDLGPALERDPLDYGYDLPHTDPCYAVSAPLTGDYSGFYKVDLWLGNNYTDHTNPLTVELWKGACGAPTTLLASKGIVITNFAGGFPVVPPQKYTIVFGNLTGVTLAGEALIVKMTYSGQPFDAHIYWADSSWPGGLHVLELLDVPIASNWTIIGLATLLLSAGALWMMRRRVRTVA